MAAGPQPGSSHTRRVRSGALTQEAFEFFPASLQGELCWEPNAFRDAKKEYIFELKQTDISAIESAITSFKGASSPLAELSAGLMIMMQRLEWLYLSSLPIPSLCLSNWGTASEI